MINLLPPEKKRQIRAGQTNVLLFRYVLATVVLAVPLFMMVGGVYLLLENSKKIANETIQNSEVKSAQYRDVKTKAQEFNNNLQVAKTILDKEVRYSKIAPVIAQSLPPGIYLESLSLDAKTFGQPVTLNALAKTYNDAVRLKNTFEESSHFSDVHLLSVSHGSGDNSSTYPVSITISVIIDPEIVRSS